MDDAVSAALHARTPAPEGLAKMLLVSIAAHVVLITLAAVAPASFWLRPIDARSSPVTIDLGPSQGPDNGGRTSIGVHPVQRAVPGPARVQPARPPAATDASANTRELTPAPTPTPAASREVPAGNTLAANAPAATATGVQSASMGLSTADGGGTGARVNVGDFCCPDYIGTMIQRIHQHWNSSRGGGWPTMRFTIQRDGAITQIQLVRSSGNQMLDFLAERALLAVRQLPPLPDAYPNSSLTVDLEFQYQP